MPHWVMVLKACRTLLCKSSLEMYIRLPVSHDETVLYVSAASLQMHPTLQSNKTISKCVYWLLCEMILKSYFANFVIFKFEDTIPSFTVCMYRPQSYQSSYTTLTEMSHIWFLFGFAHLICFTHHISLMWLSSFTGMRKLHVEVDFYSLISAYLSTN